MLSNQLLGVYRQYKQDTDSVASWLASTAKACGYPADLLTSIGPKSGEAQPPRSGRLKGKQRSKARGGGGAKQKPSQPPKASKHIIAIKDFLPLANFIAGRPEPTSSVPDVFSTTIDRLIALRSGFGEKMSAEGAQLDPESDEKHDYFVGVLEAVKDALRPRMTPKVAIEAVEVAIETGSKVSGDTTEDLGNRFSALSVDQPSQAFIDSFRNAPHERPKPRDDDPISYEAETQTSIEEVLFAFTFLMNDLSKIREHIRYIWLNHRNGFFDLAAAAVATNTAISLARGLIDDVSPLFKGHKGGAWGITNKFFLILGMRKGYTPQQIYLNGKDNFNYDLYELANDSYLIAFRLLISFVDVLDPRDLPLIKEGMFGQYDPNSDRSSHTGRKKFQEDQILLMEFFTELMTVIRLIPNYPVEDEFLRGMRELEKTSTVSFSLVFAAQTFLDIHHTLRSVTKQSLATMVEEVEVMDRLLERHLEFHEKLKISNWPASNDNQLRELSRLMKRMSEDPVHEAKARTYRRVGMPVPPEMEPHRILAYSPVLSGLYLFRLRTEMYDVGVSVANAWGSITYTAHLYNALARENLLEGQWQDMDVTLSLLGDSNMWVGGERPETLGDYFQKFCLQMGVSAAAFTANRRRKTAIASRAGPRGIKDGAPVSSMFKGHIATGTEMNWTPELIEDIVSRSNYQRDESAEDGEMIMMQIDDPQQLRERNRRRQQRAKARATGKHTASDGLLPEELVEALVLALNSESLEMAFPYLLMHRWCWKLLRSVKDACDPLLRQIYTPSYMEKESELPWLIGYIFMSASGLEGGVQDLRLLRSAAEPFNGMISAGAGQVAIQVARKIGKNVQFEIEESEEETEAAFGDLKVVASA